MRSGNRSNNPFSLNVAMKIQYMTYDMMNRDHKVRDEA